MNDEQNELEYLRFFYVNADFGPADSDVRAYINERFIKDGGTIPVGYEHDNE